MKKQIIGLMLVLSCLTSGCSFGKSQKMDQLEQKEYQLDIQSEVKQEDCFVCGNHSESLMPYYGKRDSIGIIHWNSGSIMDTEVRTYDDEGNEIFEQGSNMKSSSFGKNNGTVMFNTMPIRGISEITVTYKDADEVDLDLLKQRLCQECLEQVLKIYIDQKNLGKDDHVATIGYCLVDFQTKRLYTLSEPYSTYFIRDYHVSYEIKEDNGGTGDKIEIQIFYAPERDS